jgi:hypothetical protein
MIETLLHSDSHRRPSFRGLASWTASWAVPFLVAGVVLATATAAGAQQAFKSPDEAMTALVTAAKNGDRKAVLAVLGRGGSDIVSSGDDVSDSETRDKFLAAYDDKHEIKMDGDSKATAIIGKDDFPFPIPLVRKDGTWQFDTAAGREEILARRIGRNELDTIQAMLAYLDAQNEYAEKDRGAGVGVYAQRIVSSRGKKDGLYWPSAQGEEQSPLGELVAQATAQGYRAGRERIPFHGYYYKILSQQGPDAPGGEMDYEVRGKMIGGFALIAYPAQYGNSGVMTFIVNHKGTIYEKDLGSNTAKLVPRITWFNPDKTWKKTEGLPP